MDSLFGLEVDNKSKKAEINSIPLQQVLSHAIIKNKKLNVFKLSSIDSIFEFDTFTIKELLFFYYFNLSLNNKKLHNSLIDKFQILLNETKQYVLNVLKFP